MSLRIYRAINIFLPVNVSLYWLNNVFVIPANNKWSIIVHCYKCIGLAACIALRVVGAVYLSFSFEVGVQFAQSSGQWEARGEFCRNVPNPADQEKQGNLD
jgi:hypothetical protein